MKYGGVLPDGALPSTVRKFGLLHSGLRSTSATGAPVKGAWSRPYAGHNEVPVGYLRLPQKRWTREQASSSTSSELA
jgi:hypothetical protein